MVMYFVLQMLLSRVTDWLISYFFYPFWNYVGRGPYPVWGMKPQQQRFFDGETDHREVDPSLQAHTHYGCKMLRTRRHWHIFFTTSYDTVMKYIQDNSSSFKDNDYLKVAGNYQRKKCRFTFTCSLFHSTLQNEISNIMDQLHNSVLGKNSVLWSDVKLVSQHLNYL